jgi:hypothetical protein
MMARSINHVVETLMRAMFMFKGALLVFLALAGGASAQQSNDRPTYKSLLEEGYEVTSFMFVPSESSTRIAGNQQPDTVAIGLQKGNMTAACWTSFVNWHAQNMSALPCNLLK